MDKWFIYAKRADFDRLAREFRIDPVTARILRNRDVVGDEEIRQYLYGTLEDLNDPHTMKDVDKAAELLWEAVRNHRKIRVIGDYDIDGVCSTYILVKGLRMLGADVDYAIPHRVADGYGLNMALVEQAYESGRELLITCDNGIAAAEQIAYAKTKGMTVVVTDHHEIPYEETTDGGRTYLLPPADAVVDPKQEDCPYPFAEICGCVVAWKLMQVMYERAPVPVPEDFLEIAAFATIGDVMELRKENRIIVRFGLRQLSDTGNIGLRALMDVCGLSGETLTPYHVGFVMGPCMNATGRLDTAERALRLLLTEDRGEAVAIATDLKELNDSRKSLTLQGTEQAIRMVEETGLGTDRVLVVYLPECHESLAGIIAGRLRERFCKPVFVLTDGEEGVKGSGRSIEAYSMYEELSKCRELLTRFGGHRMAAGLSLEKENVDALRRMLNEKCTLTEEDMIHKVYIDMKLPPAYVTEKLIHEWELLAPFGNGNAKPVFGLGGMKLLSMNIIGRNRNVCRLTVQDPEGRRYGMIRFGDPAQLQDYIKERFGEEQLDRLMRGAENEVILNILYYPSINEFRGKKEIQLEMLSFQA